MAHESQFVRRAAASHFQFAPKSEALPPLLALLAATPPGDTHLRHVVRMAIREHLKQPSSFDQLGAQPVPLDLVLAVPSSDAAAFLKAKLEATPSLEKPTRAAILTHVARHGSPGTVSAAIKLARAQSNLAPIDQAARLGSLLRGLEERGEIQPHPELLAWAQELAPRILDDEGDPSWFAAPHPDHPGSDPPWIMQDRMCRDGKTARVLSSLPIGAAKTEVLTGILRSKPFPAPAQFSFWICGHRGFADQPAHDKNRVRLVHTESKQELRSAFPPRNDVCQRVEWTLAEFAGEPVQLEVIDGDDAGAYAWLGITRIEPNLINVDTFHRSDARSVALQQIATLLKVTAPAGLRDRLRPYLPPSPAPAPIPVSEAERARLDMLIRDRTAAFAQASPNPAHGQSVFETQCAACHQIEGKGALLGPQLDGIGGRGVARICEDILDPNRNVDAHFYLTTFELKDGTSSAGFVRAESGAVLLVVDAVGTEHRIQKNSIAKQVTTPLSLMPPTFGEVLSKRDFNDLVAWLLTR